jgi:hypothetical protein
VVQFVVPQPNATFLKDVDVNIQARISNAGADINRVEVVVDGATIATLPQPNAAGAATFSVSQTWKAASAGAHTIGVTAFRGDGSSSAPATVSINVIDAANSTQPSATPAAGSNPSGQNAGGNPTPLPGSGGGDSQAAPPTNAPKPTDVPPPTNPPPPTATPTPSAPMATFKQGANLRAGASTLFNPPVGSFAQGQTAEILARTQSGEWYKVKYFNGSGWVFGQLIDVSGDTAKIPIDAGPPVPTLTPTPIPVTPTPQTAVNLVAGSIRINNNPVKCGTLMISVDIANNGTQANPSGGSLSVQDVRAADGSNSTTTQGAFGIIQPGQTVASGPIPLTVQTNVEEDHRLIIIVDPGGSVAETNKGDNRTELVYRLHGPC